MSLAITDVSYSYPGESELFHDVSFKVGDGEHWAILGENGAGKSTLLQIIAGKLKAETGRIHTSGELLYLPQDLGFAANESLRQTLLQFAPQALRYAGTYLFEVEVQVQAGDVEASMNIAQAIADWSEAGGYQLEGKWDASTRRVLGLGIGEVLERPIATFSGGERKQVALDVMLHSDAPILLLDEPDNYLDISAKVWLEEKISSSSKTILAVSHDRQFLANGFDKIVTLEGAGVWVHGNSYSSYEDARQSRQAALGDAVERWKEEERRLFDHMKLMKQRASVNPKNAPKARAAETRLQRFRDGGPPPPPVVGRPMRARLKGGDASRRSFTAKEVVIANEMVLPFSDSVRHNERIGLIGPNGTGKSHVLRALAGLENPESGSVHYGDTVKSGMFTQGNDRPDFLGRVVGNIVENVSGSFESAMGVLARYGLDHAYRLEYEALSGGQRARLEILQLELEGCNLLLLDEPTDNLDVESATLLEAALEEFDGACVSVSHDRIYLSSMDRYWLLTEKGEMCGVVDWGSAHDALKTGYKPKNAVPLI